MPQIADFNVHPLPPESDHTPLSFAFYYNHKNEVKVSGTPYISYKWDENKAAPIVNEITDLDNPKLHTFFNTLIDNENTDKVADMFHALIDCTVQKRDNLKITNLIALGMILTARP